ncbi:MAG TPA: TonB-dependent receptor [Steroidobacteraceae bacterium]|nr:TonB-dependent receptor [Steroidobacteraceae bacterium]
MIRSFCAALVSCGLIAAVDPVAAGTDPSGNSPAGTLDSTSPGAGANPNATDAGASANPDALQEVVVTARRRVEDLQNVPLTITAVTADEIQNDNIENLEDLSSFVPNLKISQDRATSSTINVYIRGVGQSDPLWGFQPGVGIYIDDVYLARPQAALLDVLDVSRLEVLSGPQGTLYGKNTIAGAIKYITRDIDGPATVTASATVGNYGEHDFKLYGSMPVIADHVYFGVSLGDFQHGGYGEVVAQPGVTQDSASPLGAPLSNKDILAGRANLTFTWGESSKLKLIADDILDNSNASGGQRLNDYFNGQVSVLSLPALGVPALPFVTPNAPPLENPFDSYNNLPAGKDFFHRQGFSGTYTQNLTSELTLKLVGAYYEGHGQQFINFSGTAENLFDVDGLYHDQQSSGEAQLTFTNDLVNAVGGFFYMDSHACGDYDADIGTLPLLGIPPLDFYVNELVAGCDMTKSTALYGDTSWKLTSQLNLDVGLRWNEDKVTAPVFQEDYVGAALAPGVTYSNPSQAPPGFIPDPGVVTDYTGNRSFVNTTPRLGFDYHFTKSVMAYIMYSRGFKSGGFDMRGNALLNPSTENGYKSETADNYELGMKTTFFDDTLLLNADVFYDPYTNAQVELALTTLYAGSVSNVTYTDNAGKQINEGAELQTAWKATRALTFGGNIGYLDSYYKDFIVPCNVFPLTPTLTPGCTPGVASVNEASSNYPMNSPHWTVSEYQSYAWDLPQGTVMARAGYDYRTYAKTGVTLAGWTATDQPGYGLINAGLSFTTHDGAWRFSIDGKNLANKYYRVAGYDFGPPPLAAAPTYTFTGGVSEIGYYGPPRTYSATISYHY